MGSRIIDQLNTKSNSFIYNPRTKWPMKRNVAQVGAYGKAMTVKIPVEDKVQIMPTPKQTISISNAKTTNVLKSESQQRKNIIKNLMRM